MDNQVIPYVFEEQEVRVIMDGQDDPWWVAKDVCDVLELTNPTIAIGGLDDDERSKFYLGRQGDTNIINLPGLFKLIFRSNKLKAKVFTRWVTHEVLPSIIKNGSYRIGNEDNPNPGYVSWLKEQRMAIAEERKYMEFAQALADRLIKTGGNLDMLSKTPCLKKTVSAMIESDPRTKQLGLFD